MSARAVDFLMFSSYLFFIFSGLLALFLIVCAQSYRICTLYTLEEANRLSLANLAHSCHGFSVKNIGNIRHGLSVKPSRIFS